MRWIRSIFSICLLLFSLSDSQAQKQYSREELITAYIYNFCTKIKWPDNSFEQENTFRILVEQPTPALKSSFLILEKKKQLNDKLLKIEFASNPDSYEGYQLVFIPAGNRVNVNRALVQLDKKPVLVVSDGYPYQEDILINFKDSEDSRLFFELNYKNIIDQGLEVSPEMIILGGDQIGIVELFEKSQQRIEEKDNSISLLENELVDLQKKLEEQNIQFNTQKSLIDDQQERIDQQKAILEDQRLQSQELIDEIIMSKDELDDRQLLIRSQSKSLLELKRELDSGDSRINEQLSEIDSLSQSIEEQRSVLGQMSNELNRQQQIVILLGVTSILGITLIIVIAISYRNIRKANRELEIQKTNLIHSAKMASIGTLAAGVAHELNNPLNVVSGTLQFLTRSVNRLLGQEEMDAEEKSDIKSLLKESQSSINKAIQIISGLNMSVSRNKNPIKINLKEITGNVLALVKSKYPTDIDIISTVEDVHFQCLPDRVHYAISAVLDNACKAVLNNDGQKKIWIKTSISQKIVSLEIKNNGPKIPEKIIDYIFDPFYTTRDPGEGNGLGLYNTYNIVQQHEGTIDVVNSEYISFILRFPKELSYAEVEDFYSRYS